MAVLPLRSVLLWGVFASLSSVVSASRNYTTSYNELDMAQAQLNMMASRPDDCPPW